MKTEHAYESLIARLEHFKPINLTDNEHVISQTMFRGIFQYDVNGSRAISIIIDYNTHRQIQNVIVEVAGCEPYTMKVPTSPRIMQYWKTLRRQHMGDGYQYEAELEEALIAVIESQRFIIT